MSNKINHLIDAYRQLKQQQQDCVLATIIETLGSTYQKAGACMIITKTDELIGLLGGGCFERDLVEQAREVFATASAKTVFYDMRSAEDVVWGLGLGCNGAVRIFLQLLRPESDYSPLNIMAEVANTNQAGILVTVVESAQARYFPGEHQFLPVSATNHRQLQSPPPFPFAASALQSALQQTSILEIHNPEPAITAFYHYLQAPWRLLVCGAGADAVPLVKAAKALGWYVTLVDHRPGHIKISRFPDLDQLLHSLPEELPEQLPIDQFNALILMTHNLEYDQRYLQAIAHSKIPFIGLLGPEHRKQRLLRSLGNTAQAISDRVYGPVGLDIGAETPAEIALSIMAGIHAGLNGRSGRQLSPNIGFEADEFL